MKRHLLAISCLLLIAGSARANHITGGEIYYTYLGQAPNGDYQYRIMLRLYRDHFSSGAQLDPTAAIAIFDKGSNAMVWNQTVARKDTIHLHLVSPSPCITNPPTVWYEVGRYEVDVTLPGTGAGYVIAYQRCCRINGINNLVIPSSNIGTTYTAEIPGTGALATAPENNSARFIGADTVIVCANNPFTYSFAAFDADGDPLTYSFCTAYTGGSAGAPIPDPPAAPPYTPVPYSPPFSASVPLGFNVSVNSSTGLITGIAPMAGIYVVTVCVTERRGNVVIARQRKDLQIKVGDCNIAQALLNPRPTTCDGFTVNFQNDAPPSPLINSYFWDFGTGVPGDTSNLATPTFTFQDTGVFIVKLVTNRNQQCSDSTTTTVRVFPGFFPGFTVTGGCFSNPFTFTDTTRTAYGVVDTWSWSFGDPSSTGDTSHIQNPQWTYAGPGPVNIQLIVTNSKGCVDTAQLAVNVLDKPSLSVAFQDTLVCRNDPLQLQAIGTGNFTWTPPVNIVNANTATPTVTPQNDTWYFVDLDDNGCFNRDSVHVRVVATVTVQAMGDTTICQGDAIQLRVASDGLTFNWSPAGNLNDPTIKDPIATTNNTTWYYVTAGIGTCNARDSLLVTTIPYPIADAGNSQAICYNTPTQLNGSIVGSSFTWTPTKYLSDSTILNPVAFPPRTTTYILSSYDTRGCPKPGRDTVVITVNPKIKAFAGNDTTVIVGQPLQFQGTGGINYFWSPPFGLSNPGISNPIGVYNANTDSVRYKLLVTDEIGCSDSANVTVYVYKTIPYVFVPSAFTPNNDGLNDVIRPIAVGIQRINYFAIYNRWGQRVFYTTVNKMGWDGRISGKIQATGVYVWMLSAIDYLGKPLFLKGTVTLIR